MFGNPYTYTQQPKGTAGVCVHTVVMNPATEAWHYEGVGVQFCIGCPAVVGIWCETWQLANLDILPTKKLRSYIDTHNITRNEWNRHNIS